MDTFKNDLTKVLEEIESKLGHKLDLENETYVLQTPSAYVKIGFEDDEEGEKTLSVGVTGGKLKYFETDNDIYGYLYGSNDDIDEEKS